MGWSRVGQTHPSSYPHVPHSPTLPFILLSHLGKRPFQGHALITFFSPSSSPRTSPEKAPKAGVLFACLFSLTFLSLWGKKWPSQFTFLCRHKRHEALPDTSLFYRSLPVTLWTHLSLGYGKVTPHSDTLHSLFLCVEHSGTPALQEHFLLAIQTSVPKFPSQRNHPRPLSQP